MGLARARPVQADAGEQVVAVMSVTWSKMNLPDVLGGGEGTGCPTGPSMGCPDTRRGGPGPWAGRVLPALLPAHPPLLAVWGAL